MPLAAGEIPVGVDVDATVFACFPTGSGRTAWTAGASTPSGPRRSIP